MDKVKQDSEITAFWILLGLAAIIPLVGWYLGKIRADLPRPRTEPKKLSELHGKLKTTRARIPTPIGKKATRGDQSSFRRVNFCGPGRRLYERQEKLMTWPPPGRSPPESIPMRVESARAELYRTRYAAGARSGSTNRENRSMISRLGWSSSRIRFFPTLRDRLGQSTPDAPKTFSMPRRDIWLFGRNPQGDRRSERGLDIATGRTDPADRRAVPSRWIEGGRRRRSGGLRHLPRAMPVLSPRSYK